MNQGQKDQTLADIQTVMDECKEAIALAQAEYNAAEHKYAEVMQVTCSDDPAQADATPVPDAP